MTLRRIGLAAVVASGVVVLSGGMIGATAPAGGATAQEAMWSLRTGIAAAVVQTPPETSLERSAPAKLRLDLLPGGAALVVLALARTGRQRRAPGPGRRRRLVASHVAFERGPPLLPATS